MTPRISANTAAMLKVQGFGVVTAEPQTEPFPASVMSATKWRTPDGNPSQKLKQP